MDQVQVFFAALKKHHFWILVVIVLILGVIGWYMAADDLAAQYKTNRNRIESEFKELQAITSRTEHPNKSFESGTMRLVSNLKQDVQTAWAKIYNHQKTSVLAWPKELGSEFLEWIDKNPADANIPPDWRERYLNHIKEEFPRLLTIVDARPFWETSEETRSAPGGRSSPSGQDRSRPRTPDRDYKVIWNIKNQQEIDQQLDSFIGVPSSEEVRYCQENLWVYHALLKAIAQVNEGATGHHNAKIKEIITLAVAQDASAIINELLGQRRVELPAGVDPSQSAASASSEPGTGGETAPRAAPEEPPEDLATDGKKRLDDKRYVDEYGKPMRSAESNPPQFKRLPVVLQLRMDQREIANLLVTLANSPLPVDIRQLRINTKMQGGSTTSRPTMFGTGSEAPPSRGKSSSNPVHQDKSLAEALQTPYDINVELVGMIYIFNPPDKKAFALDDDMAAAAAEDAAADALKHPTDETPAPAGGAASRPAGAAGDTEPADAPAPASEVETDEATPASRPVPANDGEGNSLDGKAAESDAAETELKPTQPAAEDKPQPDAGSEKAPL